MEDELSGSLRQLKAHGQDDLLRDRFDSVFRRNLVEIDPKDTERKRVLKAQHKFRMRQGAMFGGTLTARLDRKNKKMKAKLDEKERKLESGTGLMLNDDIIMI